MNIEIETAPRRFRLWRFGLYKFGACKLLQCNRGQNEHGQTRTGLLMTVLIIGVLVWLGSQVIPFYYDEMELKGLMESQAKLAGNLNDLKIRKTIQKKMVKLGVPANPEDLKINRFNGKIIIELEYDEYLIAPWFNGEEKVLHIFHMNPRAERYFD